MENKVKIEKTLDYYDGPILFIGVDAVDTKYICVRISRGNKDAEYISTPISDRRLNLFLNRTKDLRSILKEPDAGWYILRAEDDETFGMAAWEEDLPVDFLPSSGLYFEPDLTEIFYSDNFNHFKLFNNFKRHHTILRGDAESHIWGTAVKRRDWLTETTTTEKDYDFA